LPFISERTKKAEVVEEEEEEFLINFVAKPIHVQCVFMVNEVKE